MRVKRTSRRSCPSSSTSASSSSRCPSSGPEDISSARSSIYSRLSGQYLHKFETTSHICFYANFTKEKWTRNSSCLLCRILNYDILPIISFMSIYVFRKWNLSCRRKINHVESDLIFLIIWKQFGCSLNVPYTFYFIFQCRSSLLDVPSV